MQSNAYWEARAAARVVTYERSADNTLRLIGNAFQRANGNLLSDIDRIFGNYAKRHNLTPEQAKDYLAQAVSHAEYERLLTKLQTVTDPAARADLLARINAPSAQFRMSRLEALQANIEVEMARLAEVQLHEATAVFRRTISDAYGRTLFDVQRGTGSGWRVSAMSTGAVQEILRNPWSGAHYSARIWANQSALADWLSEELTSGIATGRSVARLSREMSDRLGVGYRQAERLVRTETNFFANQAALHAYKEAGITHYRYLALLDNRTSQACQDMDGEIVAVAAAKIGVDLPPLHPNCRSTTTAYFDEETLLGMERRARDPVTGEVIKVPAGMTYKEWRQHFYDEYGRERVDSATAAQRYAQRKEAEDRRQWEGMQKVLPGATPKTLSAFRDMKYAQEGAGTERYRDLMADYRHTQKRLKDKR